MSNKAQQTREREMETSSYICPPVQLNNPSRQYDKIAKVMTEAFIERAAKSYTDNMLKIMKKFGGCLDSAEYYAGMATKEISLSDCLEAAIDALEYRMPEINYSFDETYDWIYNNHWTNENIIRPLYTDIMDQHGEEIYDALMEAGICGGCEDCQ
jgi:hypothetical protein